MDHLADKENNDGTVSKGAWRKDVVPLEDARMRRSRATKNKREAESMRELLLNFFNNEGAVEWQHRMINVERL